MKITSQITSAAAADYYRGLVKEAAEKFGHMTDEQLREGIETMARNCQTVPQFDDDDPLTADRSVMVKSIGFAATALAKGNRAQAQTNLLRAMRQLTAIKAEYYRRRGVRHTISTRRKAAMPRMDEAVDKIFRSLAKKRDGLGDYIKPRALWNEFVNMLGDCNLDPEETPRGDGEPQIRYVKKNGEAKTMTRKNFERRIRSIRKEKVQLPS